MPPLPSRTRSLAGPFVLLLSVASPLLAQTGAWPAGAPSAGPGWLPQVVALSEVHPFTAAERAEVMTVLDAIEAVLRRVPVLGRPDGFELEPVFVARGDLVPTRDRLYTYQYRLRFWVPGRAGQLEAAARVIVTVNPYPEYLLEVPGRGPFGKYGDGPDETFYFSPRVTGTLPGGGVVYDRLDYPRASFVQGVQVGGDESPYLPVSRERVLRAELARYAEVEGAENAPTFPGLAEAPSPTVGMRRQLATLSPSELAWQACFDVVESYWKNEGVAGGMTLAFVPPAPDADCIVVGNPAFYAPRGSPVSPRVIVVWLQVNGWDSSHPDPIDGAMVKVFETLDWAALGALVKPQD